MATVYSMYITVCWQQIFQFMHQNLVDVDLCLLETFLFTVMSKVCALHG